MYKIATWNVNSINVRLPHVLDWLQQHKPDVLALQETKVVDEKFPVADIEAAGYQVAFAGQRTYNGVAVLHRQTEQQRVVNWPDYEDPQRRILAVTLGDLRVINVYIPNGAAVDSDKYAYKLGWLTAMQAYVKTQLASYEKLVILGDYNIAPTDLDVHDPAVWTPDKVHVSPPERAAFQALQDMNLVDTFRLHHTDAGHYSWWDYRMAGFRRDLGLRIDHILVTPAMAKLCTAAYIDKAPRGLERPSDHTPVVAEFNLSAN